MATWNEVSRIALTLPGTAEESSYGGTRSWSVNNKGFVWERPLRRATSRRSKVRRPHGPFLAYELRILK